MPTRTVKTMAAVLTAGLCLSAANGSANAQERPYPGLVRITDAAPPAPAAETDDVPNVLEESPEALPVPEPADDAATDENAPAHDAPPVAVYHDPHAYVTDAYGNVVYDPAAARIHPVPVVYTHFYPVRWYGSPGPRPVSPAPMIYMPTDTTQLGFYYQRVPQWHPQPWRLPPGPAGYGVAHPYYPGYGYHGAGVVYGTPVPRESVPKAEQSPAETESPADLPPKPSTTPEPTNPAAQLYLPIR